MRFCSFLFVSSSNIVITKKTKPMFTLLTFWNAGRKLTEKRSCSCRGSKKKEKKKGVWMMGWVLDLGNQYTAGRT